jgi:DNA modification methylase
VNWRILQGDVREKLAELDAGSVQTCVTSPPYWGQRDYGVAGQLGLNQTPTEYVTDLVGVFREVRRVLCADGTVWLNLGDSFQNAKGQAGGIDPKQPSRRHGLRPQDRAIPGLKPKDLVGIPWMVAFALRADGWWLRRDQVWNKPNAHPEPVSDRPSTSHEYVFLLSVARRYYYNAKAIGDPPSPALLRQMADGYNGQATRDYAAAGAPNPSATKLRVIASARRRLERDGMLWVNSRSVWTINTESGEGDHCAVMPEALAEKCILAGSRPGDTVLDPFTGSGTTGAVAVRHQRSFVGCELNPAYVELARKRIGAVAPIFAEEATA